MKTVGVKIQDNLEYQRFRLLEDRIKYAMSEANVDWEEEFEQKREEAFEDYKRRRSDIEKSSIL